MVKKASFFKNCSFKKLIIIFSLLGICYILYKKYKNVNESFNTNADKAISNSFTQNVCINTLSDDYCKNSQQINSALEAAKNNLKNILLTKKLCNQNSCKVTEANIIKNGSLFIENGSLPLCTIGKSLQNGDYCKVECSDGYIKTGTREPRCINGIFEMGNITCSKSDSASNTNEQGGEGSE